MRRDLKKHKAKLSHFTVEKLRRSPEVKTCAQGHPANQELDPEQKWSHQTCGLCSSASCHCVLSQHPQRGPRACRKLEGSNFEF